jgi:hypothetical protein
MCCRAYPAAASGDGEGKEVRVEEAAAVVRVSPPRSPRGDDTGGFKKYFLKPDESIASS